VQEWFAAGKEDHRHPEGLEVVQEGQALLQRQLPLRLGGRGLGVAVDAFQVAAAGDVPDHHRPLVLGKLQQVRGQTPGMAAVAQDIGGFHRPAIEFGDADHSSRFGNGLWAA